MDSKHPRFPIPNVGLDFNTEMRFFTLTKVLPFKLPYRVTEFLPKWKKPKGEHFYCPEVLADNCSLLM